MQPDVVFSNEIDGKSRDFALRNGDCHAAASNNYISADVSVQQKHQGQGMEGMDESCKGGTGVTHHKDILFTLALTTTTTTTTNKQTNKQTD